jgi:hypothetical protein
MGEQFGRDSVAFAAQVIDGIGQVHGIPVDDSHDDQIETGSPELLRVRTAVSDAPLLERADHLGEGVALLTLVQAGVTECRSCDDSSQSSMNRVRSIRPSS